MASWEKCFSSPRCAEQSLESSSSDDMLEDESAGDEDSGESDDDEWDPSLATPAVAGRRRTRSGSGRRSRHSVSANAEILFLYLFPYTKSPQYGGVKPKCLRNSSYIGALSALLQGRLGSGVDVGLHI